VRIRWNKEEKQMNVNKCTIVGRLGADPELRYTPSGTAVANFRVATNESWKNKEGKSQTRVEWHRIVVWGRQAETSAEYLKKGSEVFIEGRLQTREWVDKEQVKRYVTEVVAQRVQFGAQPKVTDEAEEPSPEESTNEPPLEAATA